MKPVALPPKVILAWKNSLLSRNPRARHVDDVIKYEAQDLRELWQTYTTGRKNLGRLKSTMPNFVTPYLLGFHLMNVARFIGVWQRAFDRGLKARLKGQKSVRLIDVGCGTGAGALAALFVLRQNGVEIEEIELFDRSRHLLDCAEEMLNEVAPEIKRRAAKHTIESLDLRALTERWQRKGGGLKVVCMGYLWNEISPNPRARRAMYHLLKAVQGSGDALFAMVEPAAEQSARESIWLRDEMVNEGWGIEYPCPRSELCPMTSDGRDWCYSEFEIDRTKEMQRVEKILGVSRHTAGCAGYVFSSSKNQSVKSQPSAKPSPSSRVVVGRPITGRDERILVCDGTSLSSHKKPGLRPLRGSIF
jgi:ribosomal protein RSM22 (predicted rRNA methylase)